MSEPQAYCQPDVTHSGYITHMNRILLFIILFSVMFVSRSIGQAQIDSLKTLIDQPQDDTLKIDRLLELTQQLYGVNAEEAIRCSRDAGEIANKINDIPRKALALKCTGIANYYKGSYVAVVDDWTKSLEAYRSIGDKNGIANLLSNLGAVFETTGGTESALSYYLEALKIAEETGDKKREATVLQNLGVLYVNQGDFEKAEPYYIKALSIFKSNNFSNQGIATISMNLSEVYMKSGEYNKATAFSNDAIDLFAKENNASLPQAIISLCDVLIKQGEYSKALKQAKEAYKIASANDNLPSKHKAVNMIGAINNSLKSPKAIGNYHEGVAIGERVGKNTDLQNSYTGLYKALRGAKKYKEAVIAQDSLTTLTNFMFNNDKESKLSNLQLQFDLEKREAKIAQLNSENELKELRMAKQKAARNILMGLLGLFLIGGFGVYTFYQNRKLDKKVKERTIELSQSLENLKSTQNQLVHTEKMAALGELTAGIAHEIQNPLNFVNNFSEVSGELLLEVEEELEAGNKEDADEIIGDLKSNLEKILHHGKRASQIVKGMLDHSRTGSGEKTPTEINQLCDEFLRLSYHGIRAKDKTFNVDFETIFDEKIGTMNVVSQDIGRVILNLINNAFYAIDKRHKNNSNGVFKPKLTLITQDLEDKIEITVEDNGGGIQKEIIEKIFQPFFTTKPTGEGTGLGLSLSYDIITKGHNGMLSVDSEVGRGTIFKIELPKEV